MNFLIDRHDHPNHLNHPNRLKVLYHLDPLSYLLFPQRYFHYLRNILHLIHFLHSLLHFLRLYLHLLRSHRHHFRLHPLRLYFLNEKNLLMSLLAIFYEDVLKLISILFLNLHHPNFIKQAHQKSTTKSQANTSHHYKTSNRNYNFHSRFVFMVSIAYSIGK